MKDKCDPSLPPKLFWNNVKNLGISRSRTSTQIPFSPSQLNDYFCKNFCLRQDSFDENVFSHVDYNTDDFYFRNIDIKELWLSISSLKSSSVGIDNVSIRFIKLIFPIIGTNLLHLFNTILTHSKFPSQWKKSIIVPIPKVKHPSCFADFRPISILSSLSKVFERFMKDQIVSYLEKYSLFCEFQSGYRKAYSTATAVLKVTDDIRHNVDLDNFTILCLLDFSKAFDKVIHNRLCNKLVGNFRFSRSAALLILSYLSNRTQRVRVEGQDSEDALVVSGVPQGSILGPLLFCMYISDIKHAITHSRFHLYADDLQLYKSCSRNYVSIADCVRFINEDLDSIAEWSSVNGLKLNVSKTQSIVFNKKGMNDEDFPKLMLNNVEVSYSSSVKNLGIFLSDDLKWDIHIDSVCRRIFFLLRLLWKTTYFADVGLRRRLFLSYIFPHFLYADVVFYGMSGRCVDKLSRCFNSCIRYVFRLRKFDHISEFGNRLLGCGLLLYYDYRVCWFFKQLLKLNIPSYLFSKLSLSYNFNDNLRIIMDHRSSLCSNSSVFGKGIKMWNSLSLDTKRVNTRLLFLEKFLEERRKAVFVY